MFLSLRRKIRVAPTLSTRVFFACQSLQEAALFTPNLLVIFALVEEVTTPRIISLSGGGDSH